MSKFTFVELFAGIGGVSFGFEKMGGECLLAAEYDPEREGKRQFTQEAYKILHPNTPVTGDVFKLKGEDVPDCDILSFTFPCQSFSLAGKRKGFEDARGTLYFEAMRIAREKKPKIIFAENVKGLVNHDKGKTLDTIVHVANECGYIIDYTILNSKYFGVPQNRERWFMVGIREDLIEAEKWTDIQGNTIIPKSKKRIGEWAKTFNFDWPEQTEVTTRLKDILEDVVDEKFYISDEKTEKLIAQLEENRCHELKTEEVQPQEVVDYSRKTGIGNVRDISLSLSASDWRGLNRNQKQNAVLEQKVQSIGNVNPSGKGMNGQVYSTDAGLSPTITTNKGEGAKILQEEQFVAKKPNERLSQQAVETANNSNLEKEHGDFIQAYNHDHNKEGISPTLTTRPEGLKTAILPIVGEKPKYRIRKLTPKECFRLQSFSDEDFDKLVEAGISNSQLYKQAGNSITINVVDAIMENLQKYIVD